MSGNICGNILMLGLGLNRVGAWAFNSCLFAFGGVELWMKLKAAVFVWSAIF